jgi:hypothetical protein
MKWRSRFLLVVPILALCASLCGFVQSYAQGVELSPNAARPVSAATGETNRVGAVTESPLGSAGQFTLSGGLRPVATPKDTSYNPHGHAIAPDGTIYEGETISGIPSGRGTVTGLQGTHQQGEWRNGKPYRVSGTWVAPDGTREEGNWNYDGSKSGGTITWTDGRVYKGDWKMVEGAAELPDGSGTMTWPDGRKYEGEFRDGQMEGRGMMKYPDGKAEDGLWKQGKFVGPAK